MHQYGDWINVLQANHFNSSIKMAVLHNPLLDFGCVVSQSQCMGLITASEIGMSFRNNRPVSIRLNGIGVISLTLPKLDPILRITHAIFGLYGIATQVQQLSLNHASLADNELLLEIKIHDILGMTYGLAAGVKV